MGLNDITLPGALIKNLYGRSLVLPQQSFSAQEMPTITTDALVPQENSLPAHLGGNRKNICIIVEEEGQKFFAEDNLTFLTNILNACKLTLEDVAIINKAYHAEVSPAFIEKNFNPVLLLLFGLGADDAGYPMNIPDYKLFTFDNKTFYTAPHLSYLMDNVEQKRIFWNNLKPYFIK